MIDFDSTSGTRTMVDFRNEHGEVVKSYPLSELEAYVTDNHLNLSYDFESEFTGGDIDDPANWVNTEVEVYTPIDEYISENWFKLCNDFYNHKNPTEHKVNNTPQKTLRQVG